MRVLVCGGRAYRDPFRLQEVMNGLHKIHGFTEVIEGGAHGADRIARLWAQAHAIQVTTVEADWRKHGRAAGPMRNAAMLALKPGLVVAFPGGPGTANMVSQACATGVQVIEIDRVEL